MDNTDKALNRLVAEMLAETRKHMDEETFRACAYVGAKASGNEPSAHWEKLKVDHPDLFGDLGEYKEPDLSQLPPLGNARLPADIDLENISPSLIAGWVKDEGQPLVGKAREDIKAALRTAIEREDGKDDVLVMALRDILAQLDAGKEAGVAMDSDKKLAAFLLGDTMFMYEELPDDECRWSFSYAKQRVVN